MPKSQRSKAASAVDQDELARSALERSRLYGLLATVFRREPSAEFLCQMKTPELLVALAAAGVDLGDEFEGGRFAYLADSLAIEYTRLFLGPGKHISPHESVQLKRGSGILWGPETPVVRQSYRDAGFDMGETETDIPDHISVELDFLSLLAREESEAWTDQNPDRAAEVLKLQHGFISKHLGKWASAFCTKVREQAEFSFYPAFADLLQSYLSGEKAEIVHRLGRVGGMPGTEGNSYTDNDGLQSLNG